MKMLSNDVSHSEVGVCVTIRSLKNGGAEKQSLLLSKALGDRYPVYLVVLSHQPRDARQLNFIEENGINTLILKGSLFQKINQFRKFLKEQNIQYIFSYLPSDTLFAGLIGRWSGVKNIYGGIRNAQMAKHKAFVLRMLHNYLLNGTISNSNKGKTNFVRRGFKEDKLLVIPNAVEINQQLRNPPFKNKLNIITVARFVPQKDYLTAIKSIALLHRNLPEDMEISYRMVGYGEQESQIKNWIKEYGLSEVADLIVNPPNLDELYLDSDIYLCSSAFEGLSNTIMEAMECSLPIVATDVGDNTQLVHHQQNGFVVPTGDVKGLAEALLELVHSYDLRARQGHASFEILTAEYSFQRFKENYFQLIQPKKAMTSSLTTKPVE